MDIYMYKVTAALFVTVKKKKKLETTQISTTKNQ